MNPKLAGWLGGWLGTALCFVFCPLELGSIQLETLDIQVDDLTEEEFRHSSSSKSVCVFYVLLVSALLAL